MLEREAPSEGKKEYTVVGERERTETEARARRRIPLLKLRYTYI